MCVTRLVGFIYRSSAAEINFDRNVPSLSLYPSRFLSRYRYRYRVRGFRSFTSYHIFSRRVVSAESALINCLNKTYIRARNSALIAAAGYLFEYVDARVTESHECISGFSPETQLKRVIYHCKQSVKFVRKYISRTHVPHILRYSSYPVRNVWVQLLRALPVVITQFRCTIS